MKTPSSLPVAAVLLLALAPGVARAAEYYVDNAAAGASDDNPGTESEPWVHCPGLDGWTGSAGLEAGDVVYFSSAGVWSAGGVPSVLEPAGGVVFDGNSWGTGTRAVLRATGEMGRGVVTFREDHPTLPTVVRGFEVDGNDQLAAGVVFDWGYAPAELLGAAKRVEDCVIHDFYSRAAEGSWKYGVVVSAWGGETIANVEVLDCVVYHTPRTGIVNYVGNDVTTNMSVNVVVRGCEVYGTGEDPDSDGHGIALKNHVVDALVEYNYLHDTAGGGVDLTNNSEPGFMGPENAVVRYNIITHTGGRNSGAGVRFSDAGDRSADVYGNLMAENGNSGVSISWQVAGAMSVRIFNNTLVGNCALAGYREIYVQENDATVSALEIVNNLIVTLPTIAAIIDEDGVITAHSNNVYFRPGGGDLVETGADTYTADTVSSWEPTALTADPLLADSSQIPTGFVGEVGVDIRPDTEGLAPAEGSPAIDAGAVLDPRYAGSINGMTRPLGAGWDIGAYEMGMAQPCSSLGGTCCEAGQTCEGGAMSGSTDCGAFCCVGGTCATPEEPGEDAAPDPGADAPADLAVETGEPAADGSEDGTGGDTGGEGCGCGIV
jgi:hypothetical protein